MADHLPEDIVRAEEIDTIMSGVCDNPCAVQDVASGCSCAMAKAVVKNLQMEVVNHLGQIERLRAAADGARREAAEEMRGHIALMLRLIGHEEIADAVQKTDLPTDPEKKAFLAFAATQIVGTSPQPDPVAADPHAPGWLQKDVEKARRRAVELGLPEKTPWSGKPDPVAAAREAALAAAMARWRSEASREPAYWDKPSAETIAMNKACAALAALEKGEG